MVTRHGELRVREKTRNKDFKALCLSLVASLKSCAKTKDLREGTRLHDYILQRGLLACNTHIGNSLINMYAKCGELSRARTVLDQLPVRDAVSWSALIAGYAQKSLGKEALKCYDQMRSDGVVPNAITYISVLKACGITGAVERGEHVHDEIASQGLLDQDVALGNALIDMYVKCGLLTKALQVLDELPVRDVVSWSALIVGYAQKGQGEEALNCFERMQSEGLSPDAITYSCVLKACGMIGAVDKGEQIHDEIGSQGLLRQNVILGTALVDMYAKFGSLTKARQVLDELPTRDLVAWSALIAGYAEKGQGEEALNCFEKMQSEGLSPNAITYISILKACGIAGALDQGVQIHNDIVSYGLLGKNVVLGTALVDMYAKCGELTKAQQVIEDLPIRNVFSWSALIAGYVEKEQGKEALNCYYKMQNEGLIPDAITYACILKACGITQEFQKGEEIHDDIVSQGLLAQNVVLGNALVDMYVKCGVLTKARKVVNELQIRDIVSWNALIVGYSQHGQVKEALECFERLQSEGLTPDIVSWSALIGGYAQQGHAEEAMECFRRMECQGLPPNASTFVCVLNACSHSGQVEEGEMYFEVMCQKYGIAADVEHHTCMVDLFGRAGHFDKAMRVIKTTSCSNHPPVWCVLLGACRKWGNVKLAELAFKHAVQLDDGCGAAYVCMANIYADAGMQEDAVKIEDMRVRNVIQKRQRLRVC